MDYKAVIGSPFPERLARSRALELVHSPCCQRSLFKCQHSLFQKDTPIRLSVGVADMIRLQIGQIALLERAGYGGRVTDGARCNVPVFRMAVRGLHPQGPLSSSAEAVPGGESPELDLLGISEPADMAGGKVPTVRVAPSRAQKRRGRRKGKGLNPGQQTMPSDADEVSMEDILGALSVASLHSGTDSDGGPQDPQAAGPNGAKKGFSLRRKGRSQASLDRSMGGVQAAAPAHVLDNVQARVELVATSEGGRGAIRDHDATIPPQPPGGASRAQPQQQEQEEQQQELRAGDPLGRKALGKVTVNWLSQGVGALAEQIVAAEVAGGEVGLDAGSSLAAVQLVQRHMATVTMPAGVEEKCQQALRHYPTVLEHLQRGIWAALEAAQQRGELPDCHASATWQRLKQLAKTAEHRSFTRSREEPSVPPLGGGIGPHAPTAEQLALMQASIEEYVAKALDLLRMERDAELDATQDSMLGPLDARHVEDAGVADSFGEGGLGGQQGRLLGDLGNSLRNLTAVSSSTGLGGTHLVTLRPGRGQRLPATTISPGDMVCVRVDQSRGRGSGGNAAEGAGGAVAGALPPGCMRGTLHSLGDDGASISVALEVRYGDPTFSRLFGRSLRIDRVAALADSTTYDRNRRALEHLRKHGLQQKSPSIAIVAALFTPPQASSPGSSPTIPPSPPSTPSTAPHAAQGGADAGGTPLPPPLSERAAESASAAIAGGPQLDESQEAAIALALDPSVPVAVVQGPPGTGKTTVVAEIISRAAAQGEHVLAAAPTNAAVDNLVERLVEAGLRVVRVGNPARIAPAVAQRSLDFQVEAALATFRRSVARRRADLRADLRNCAGEGDIALGLRTMLKQLARTLKQREREVVESILGSAQVVLCTTVGAGDPLVARGRGAAFDLVVLDEAGQATEPSSWIPLLLGWRAVLAGDTKQLAPTIISRAAAEGGLAVSLMERAGATVPPAWAAMLTVQYRMHEAIASWASQEMYGGRLTSAPAVARRLLHHAPHVQKTRSTGVAMALLDTRRPRGTLLPECEEVLDPQGSGSLLNEGEADVVAAYVSSLLSAGVSGSSIAVQSPYLAQVQLLQSRLEDLPGAEEVEVASVDSFQGRESDAVVISMVRSNAMGAIGFLGDSRRMNVAVTRARCHVAVVCDSTTVTRNPFLRRLLQHVQKHGDVRCADEVAPLGGTKPTPAAATADAPSTELPPGGTTAAAAAAAAAAERPVPAPPPSLAVR